MRTILLILFLNLVIITSCKKKKDEPAEPTACINGPSEVDAPNKATYTWCGENADEIEWTVNGSGILGTGSSFTPTFNTKGKYTITAKGKNDAATKETSLDVFYGRTSRLIWEISSTLPRQGNPKKYWAYLYNSKADWVTDAVNGNHKLVIDSVNCRDTTITLLPDTLVAITHYAIFKNKYPTGSNKLVSVEYNDPIDPFLKHSNWYDIFSNPSGGLMNIKDAEYADNRGSTTTEPFTKLLLTGRWNLSQLDTGGVVQTATDCMGDDHMRFYADKTWKYFTGDILCSDGEINSTGTFNNLPYHRGSGFSSIIINEGSLKNKGFISWGVNDQLESKLYFPNSRGYILTTRWYGNP